MAHELEYSSSFSPQEKGRGKAHTLQQEIQDTVPKFFHVTTKRDLVGLSLYYRDNPHLSDERTVEHLMRIISHPIQDVRHHASEALGASLRVSPPDKKVEIIDTAWKLVEGDFNEHMVTSLHEGNVLACDEAFRILPPQMQTILSLRNGSLTSSSLAEFLASYPHYAVDMLEVAGKYKPPMLLEGPIQNLSHNIAKNNTADATYWKNRAILLDIVTVDNTIQIPTDLIYPVVKRDSHEEVRVRAKRAFVAQTLRTNTDTVDQTTEMVINDYSALPEDELRYAAGILPLLTPFASPDMQQKVLSDLMVGASDHESSYNRKTHIKSLAKLVNTHKPQNREYLYREDERREAVDFIIDLIQDDDPPVQEEALQCLSKRMDFPFSNEQVQRILYNIGDLDQRDWVFKRIVYQTLKMVTRS